MAKSLTIIERPTMGIATIMRRNGVGSAAVGAALGIDLPDGPSRVECDQLAVIGSGPDTWLAFTGTPTPAWPARLADALTGLASVSDQSGSYAIFRVSGGDARRLLQAGAFIDLHPDVFKAGSVATTVIAHIGVVIWKLEDATYEVATFRSYARSFRGWLEVTAAALETKGSAS